MKLYSFATLLLAFTLSEARASGGVVCDLKATVKQIQVLGILGETVGKNHVHGTDTYRYIAVLDVISAKMISGFGDCATGERLIELKEEAQVRVGDELKIESAFMHDRPGHSLSYRLK